MSESKLEIIAQIPKLKILNLLGCKNLDEDYLEIVSHIPKVVYCPNHGVKHNLQFTLICIQGDYPNIKRYVDHLKSSPKSEILDILMLLYQIDYQKMPDKVLEAVIGLTNHKNIIVQLESLKTLTTYSGCCNKKTKRVDMFILVNLIQLLYC
jgi:hypothetical protein